MNNWSEKELFEFNDYVKDYTDLMKKYDELLDAAGDDLNLVNCVHKWWDKKVKILNESGE